MPPAALIGGTALLGGLAGGIGKNSSQTSTSTVDAGKAGPQEQQYGNAAAGQFGNLNAMASASGGVDDVRNAYNSQQQLAATYGDYAKSGGQPTAQDLSTSQGLAQSIFNPQRTALGQSFTDQTTAANRQSALMGRSTDDPILQAKLGTEKMRQSAMLDANQNSWATQYALQQPFQRLGFQQQQSGLLSGLASQAMANRQAIASMGSQLQSQAQNFRLATATRNSDQQTQSGGGFANAITGAIGGFGTGIGMSNALSNMGSGSYEMPTTPMVSGYSQGAAYMNGINPYSAAGGGLSYNQPAANPFSGSMPAMGGQFGQSRNIELGSPGSY